MKAVRGLLPVSATVVVLATGMLAGCRTTELPPVGSIPLEERLWTATLSSGSSGSDPVPNPIAVEIERVNAICRDPAPPPGVDWDVHRPIVARILECQRRTLKAARYRILTVRAEPDAGSRAVAYINQGVRSAEGGWTYEWSVEPVDKPGVFLAWPDADNAFDYGLHLSGVHKRGNWVRLLRSIPVDGWLPIWSGADPPDSSPSYIRLEALAGQIVGLTPLLATWPDGSTRQTRQFSSFVIDTVAAGVVTFREEVPSDFDCGDTAVDPPTRPPTLRASVAEFFNRDGTARFETKYTKGC